MRVGLLITAHCNAACTHCTTSCGPHEQRALPLERIRRIMDESVAVFRKEHAPGETLRFGISGGEPFLDFPKLLAILAHGTALGAQMSCVTNGYWASSEDKANQRMGAVRAAGLGALAVSTSRFHQQYVGAGRVARALSAARRAGLATTLKYAFLASESSGRPALRRWARRCGADRIEMFPVLPYLRAGATLPEAEYVRSRPLPAGPCPQPTITVREDGTAYTCCMPGAFTDFLALGNVHVSGMQQIYDRFYLDGRQQVLRHRGPIHFAEAVRRAGAGARLRGSYESPCDLCAHIAGDPVMSAIAAGAARDFGERRLHRALAQARREAAARLAAIRSSARQGGDANGKAEGRQAGEPLG